jgi:hypothetical protein
MEVFMKFSQGSLIFLFVTICIQSPSVLQGHPVEPLPHSRIPEITQANDLKTLLTNRQATAIMGYMNNCPHCETLMKFFETLPAKYPRVNFLLVNGPQLKLHEEVAKFSDKKFKIPGYPSIVLVKNEKIKDLQIGGNTKSLEDKIKAFLK